MPLRAAGGGVQQVRPRWHRLPRLAFARPLNVRFQVNRPGSSTMSASPATMSVIIRRLERHPGRSTTSAAVTVCSGNHRWRFPAATQSLLPRTSQLHKPKIELSVVETTTSPFKPKRIEPGRIEPDASNQMKPNRIKQTENKLTQTEPNRTESCRTVPNRTEIDARTS